MTALRTLRRNLWYRAEEQAGRLWLRVCRDGVSCWLDWLPAYCGRHRYAAERGLNPDLFTAQERP